MGAGTDGGAGATSFWVEVAVFEPPQAISTKMVEVAKQIPLMAARYFIIVSFSRTGAVLDSGHHTSVTLSECGIESLNLAKKTSQAIHSYLGALL